MLRNFIIILLFLFSATSPAFAQLYPTQHRPPHQNWQYLQTPHFKLVYARGNDSLALKMGQILESQYPSVQSLVGGELDSFPIILNDYNDRSNGFVTSLHFRSEIELPPIKGKTLNPRTGNWLQNVGPHELVHALHYNNLGSFNLPRIVSLFSPDIARSFHGAIPSGITEGIAVHHESENITPGGGRGNYPYFNDQLSASFAGPDPWSMGQLVHYPAASRPFDRYYIGGYAFTNWLHQNFGDDITRKALSYYTNFPFFGYGVALRSATGFWPGQLYNRFKDDYNKSLENEKDTNSTFKTLTIPYEGREIRRPKWLNNSTLIFYGSFYNARPGFYRYQLDSENISRFITTNTINDYQYSLSPDRSEFVYGFYESDLVHDYTATAELANYDFKTQNNEKTSEDGRLYAPTFFEDKLLALQTQPASSRLVSISQNTDSISIKPLLDAKEVEIKSVVFHSTEQTAAIVANTNGMQGVWFSKWDTIEKTFERDPDIAFENGSVFDPEWHPTENKLLFSSDYTGTMQLYEFDRDQKEVWQLTRTSFGAFEGSYSPNGKKVAFIRQVQNERLPAVSNRDAMLNQKIESSLWQASNIEPIINKSVASDSILSASTHWQTGRYSAGLDWLRPRTVLPVFEEVSNSNNFQTGLAFHSSDLLQSQSYKAEFSYFEDHYWYDLVYQNKSFYPGFVARTFKQPTYYSLNDTTTLLREEQSFGLSVPLRIRFNRNIYSTSLFIRPELRRSRYRFHVRNRDQSSEYSGINVANLYAQFNYRLQQNIRDFQPNSGVIMYGELERYINSYSLDFFINADEYSFNSQQQTALRGGIIGYISPLRRWNQSLRLELEGVTQTGLIFDNQTIVSDAFSGPIYSSSNNLVSFNMRYTIPLRYVDNGGFLVPLYLSNLYLVAFTNTITDPTTADWQANSRSVFGIGIRSRFRLSNLSFDIGIGYGYEMSRDNHHLFIGDF